MIPVTSTQEKKPLLVNPDHILTLWSGEEANTKIRFVNGETFWVTEPVNWIASRIRLHRRLK